MKQNTQIMPVILAFISSIFSMLLLLLFPNLSILLMAFGILIIILVPQIILCIFSKKIKLEENIESVVCDTQLEEEKIEELEKELLSHIKMEEESCQEIHDLALRANIFSPVFKELCYSISKNLSSTTEPLSEELYKIKKDMSTFLNNVKQYEDEVKNHRMLNQVSSECSHIQNDMQTLDTNIRDVFGEVEVKITNLQIVNDKIGGIAKSITDVSEKIRILSFNASIEAARAGKAGSGFRVIANEIKNLSTMTDTYLAQIWETLKETQGVFDTIRLTIKENADDMFKVLNERQSGLKDFIQVLQGYFNDFANLFDSVNEVIDTLSGSMNKIAPVVQLHEITSQEVENMEKVIQDITKNINDVYTAMPNAKKIEPNDARMNSEAKTVSQEIRRRLTTERELQALKEGISKIAPNAKIDLGINTKSIELF